MIHAARGIGGDFSGRPLPEASSTTTTPQDKLAKPGLTKTAQKILKNQKQPPAPTLFVGNLGFDTTETTIRELLEAHQRIEKEDGDLTGTDVWIRKIRLGTFEDSGRCKGYDFAPGLTYIL